MPFQRPTLSQLRRDAAADIVSNIPGADGLLRFSNLLVTSTVLAGMANLHYGYLDWVALQSVPFTSSGEYLAGWGSMKNVTLLDATAASGEGTFTGNPNITIPAGTFLIRADQRTYVTTADQSTGETGVAVIAATDQQPGAAGNCPLGTSLTINPPVPGVTSRGTVTTDFTGGADVETQDSFRVRVMEAFQNPPQGGALADYDKWAREVNGVTRVWPKANGMGVGTVTVYFMMDQTESVHDGFPQGTNGVATDETRDTPATGDQLLVANHIFPLRPVTALVYAVAPVAAPQNFTIAHLLPNTAAMKAAIADAITGTFLRLGSAAGGTVYMAEIQASINAIPGLQDFIITSPLTDIVTTAGNLPSLGTITWS